MQILGTKSLEAAFALMAEATRRAGDSGDYNDYIRSLPVIPTLHDDFDLENDGALVITHVKFLLHCFQSKPGNSS